MLKIHTLPYNPWQMNTYIIAAENKDCIIVDAGCLTAAEEQHLISYIEKEQLKPVRLVNTHLHLDHIFGNYFVSNHFGLGVEAHKGDEFWIEQTMDYAANMGISMQQNPPAISSYLEDGQVITLGDSEIKLFHVPGHSPGSIVFYMEKENVLIAGDVLFRGSIGRTDLPGGDYATLISAITKKLMILPDETIVYSGHGASSSIGYERKNNPFL